jgi:hypothetical protein
LLEDRVGFRLLAEPGCGSPVGGNQIPQELKGVDVWKGIGIPVAIRGIRLLCSFTRVGRAALSGFPGPRVRRQYHLAGFRVAGLSGRRDLDRYAQRGNPRRELR